MSASSVHSDPELKTLAQEFFHKASEAVCQDPSSAASAFGQGGLRIVEGLVFITNATVHQAEWNVIARCIKLLGSKFGHEKEISEIAWKAAQATIVAQASSDDFVRDFINALKSHTEKCLWHISPNYLVRFDSATKRLGIGPVEAMLSTDVLSHIPSHKQFEVTSGSQFRQSIINGKFQLELSPTVWRVKVNCAAGNVAEEAAWNVDIAISLLRLHYRTNPGGLFPSIGDIEAHPFLVSDVRKTYLTTTETALSAGGGSIRGWYTIDDDILNTTLSQTFIDRAKAIFGGQPKLLAARFGQGLGWLTRGRRSEERAQRFLFFFTAIEALLSSNDKTAPVIQTIARQAAVILIDDPKERADFAAKIRKLYEARSALVHAGQRNVSQTDANQAQYIAESLYSVVMERTSLDIPFDKFQEQLGRATYGTRWP